MKIKEGLTLKKIANTWVVLPLAGAATVNFKGMLTLNETGRMLWQLLEAQATREDMAKALTCEYEVPYERALADIDAFLERLVQAGCIE